MSHNFNHFKVLVSLASFLVAASFLSTPINVFLNSIVPEELKQTTLPVTFAVGAMSIVAFCWWIFDRFLWKLPVIRDIFDVYPSVAGRWEGVLIRDTDGSEHKIALEIIQTLTKISVKTYTKSGNIGTGISVQLIRDQNGHGTSLIYTWRGAARRTNTYRGGEYYGTSILNCTIQRMMSGCYYTNRPDSPTFGSLNLKFVSKKLQSEFGVFQEQSSENQPPAPAN